MRFLDRLSGVQSMTVPEARKWMEEHPDGSYTLLDVRQPEEYEQGHIPGSVLIPVSDLPDRLGEIEAAKPVLAY